MSKFWPAILSVAIALPAQADVPISRIVSEGLGTHGINLGSFSMIVPGDPQTPAYGSGSRLRQYHIHAAKMVEITAYYCNQSDKPPEQFARWDYRTEVTEETIELDISCPLALSIAETYGTGRTESTNLTLEIHPGPDDPRVIESYIHRVQWVETVVEVPTLQIVGPKIDQWLNYVDNELLPN
ncbi:hypothetical protein [Laspinema palackyanum]|uniref:hypothetical protein n=1 Tax=Laspinema palackyanum TaxID=3231601 RepID=UPI00345D3657|nr:hypothetical protein [Laspinema sp. D2c]